MVFVFKFIKLIPVATNFIPILVFTLAYTQEAFTTELILVFIMEIPRWMEFIFAKIVTFKVEQLVVFMVTKLTQPFTKVFIRIVEPSKEFVFTTEVQT